MQVLQLEEWFKSRSGRSGLSHVVGEVDSSVTIVAGSVVRKKLYFVEAAWFEGFLDGFIECFFRDLIWIYGKEIIKFIVPEEIEGLI